MSICARRSVNVETFSYAYLLKYFRVNKWFSLKIKVQIHQMLVHLVEPLL